MKRRIEKMETALGLAPVKPPNLNDPIPRHMAEALHKIYGDPGTAVDYSIPRDPFPALRKVYGDLPDLLAAQEEAARDREEDDCHSTTAQTRKELVLAECRRGRALDLHVRAGIPGVADCPVHRH